MLSSHPAWKNVKRFYAEV